MRQRIAIVGGGVTAGLAAHLLTPLGETTLIQPPVSQASGMPEIVPRRAFFAALGIWEESEWIAGVAPDLAEVRWRDGAVLRKAKLASTEDFLIYDKGRLAERLLDSAPPMQRLSIDVDEIAELDGFERIFDCRGTNAVKNDPAYQYRHARPARTACRYMIVSTPQENRDHVMHFWTETGLGGKRRTFFRVPVGGQRISLGCSSAPDDLIARADLFAALEREGMAPSPETVLLNSAVVPQPNTFHCRVIHVTPLGNAQAFPCPLAEYGTLKALSQITVLAGGKPLPKALLQRPLSGEIDPHLPQELFS